MIDIEDLDNLKRLRRVTLSDGTRLIFAWHVERTFVRYVKKEKTEVRLQENKTILVQIITACESKSRGVSGQKVKDTMGAVRLAVAELRNPDIEKVRLRVEDALPESDLQGKQYYWGTNNRGHIKTGARSSPVATVGGLKFSSINPIGRVIKVDPV